MNERMTDMDLVEFLNARLDEDEGVAQLATAGPWEWGTFHGVEELVHPVTVGGWPAHPMNVLKSSHEGWPPNSSDKDHIARHDPARVLADVAAKRRLIDAVFRYESTIDGEWGCCHTAAELRAGECPQTPVDEIGALQILALPYADHPDYRSEWAP